MSHCSGEWYFYLFLTKLVYLMNIFPSFKDCEPEELTDWSMDEKCSFCNLQREAVSVSFSAMKLFLNYLHNCNTIFKLNLF